MINLKSILWLLPLSLLVSPLLYGKTDNFCLPDKWYKGNRLDDHQACCWCTYHILHLM